MTDPLLWDLSETARQLGGVSTRTVQRLIGAGEINARRVGRRLMVRVDSVRAYLDQEMLDKHNSGCAGKAVLKREGGSTCRESASETRMASSPGRTRRSGGRALRTDAADQLAVLLEFDKKKTPAV